jgi:apolipoprotein N-acyltransferase
MIRASNTGVTCAINRHGIVKEILKNEEGSTFMQGILFGKIDAPTNARLTFYAQYGEIFSIFCLAISGISAGWGIAQNRKNKKSACSIQPETKPSAS